MKTPGSTSTVRVIAGAWRGRKIRFAAGHIRPTGDRIRETLFNWLAPDVCDARCLDLFAGSGALGIEALSRGAAHAVFVDSDRNVSVQIGAVLTELGAEHFDVLHAKAESRAWAAHGPFDIVFLDPPFDEPDWPNLCTLLEQSGALADECRLYIESRRAAAEPELPDNWETVRHKHAGDVSYQLSIRRAS